MTFLRRCLTALKRFLLGPELHRTADRHKEAADRLDAALREVLKK